MSWKPVGSFIPNTSSSFSLTSHSWTDKQDVNIEALHVTFATKQIMFCWRRNVPCIHLWRHTIFNLLRSEHERPKDAKRASPTERPSIECLLLWCHKVQGCLSKASDKIASWAFRQPVWPPNSCLVFILFHSKREVWQETKSKCFCRRTKKGGCRKFKYREFLSVSQFWLVSFWVIHTMTKIQSNGAL